MDAYEEEFAALFEVPEVPVLVADSLGEQVESVETLAYEGTFLPIALQVKFAGAGAASAVGIVAPFLIYIFARRGATAVSGYYYD